jgi:hypothetical protein
MQADLSDFLSDLTPSRKGEVLREILENGWQKYKEENGVGLDPEEFAQLIIENNNRKKERKKTKPKPVTKERKAHSPDPKEKGKPETPMVEEVEKESVVPKDDSKDETENVDTTSQNQPTLSGMRSFSMEDLEDDDDEEVIDPLAKMKMKNS